MSGPSKLMTKLWSYRTRPTIYMLSCATCIPPLINPILSSMPLRLSTLLDILTPLDNSHTISNPFSYLFIYLPKCLPLPLLASP